MDDRLRSQTHRIFQEGKTFVSCKHPHTGFFIYESFLDIVKNVENTGAGFKDIPSLQQPQFKSIESFNTCYQSTI
jgi:hypothetical protein